MKVDVENMKERLAKMNELIQGGMGKTEARNTAGMSGTALKKYQKLMNLEEPKRRKYNRKPKMITIPVASDSDKVCVFIGSTKQVVEAAKEFLR